MRRSRPLVVALTALGLSASGATAASAAGTATERPPEISYLAPATLVTGPESAVVLGKYRCWGDSATMHLWVSVKQGGPDPTAEGSSSTVDAWYDTNISMDVAVTCDGDWQVGVVDLGRHPADFGGRELGYLEEGKAWLQFCLVPADAPEGDTTLLASKSRWVHVIGAD